LENNEIKKKLKVFIFVHVIAFTDASLFNELYSLHEINLKVFYIAETENIREWKVEKKNLIFPYEVIGRNKLDDVNFLTLSVKSWQKLNQFNPDVIIIRGYFRFAYWIALLWAKTKGKPAILWSVSHKEDKKRTYIRENIKKIFITRCNAAIAAGSKTTEYLVELGLSKEKIFAMGNVTKNDFFYKETRKFRAKRSFLIKKMNILPYNFLYIGRFSKEKNIFFLLECFKNAQKSIEMDDWGLILIGNGPQKEGITDFINKNSIKNIFFTGYKQREEVPKYLALSDILILPSISEPWGLVVNEAMAAGLPILISKKCGSYPDLIIEGENGYSFDPYNVDELTNLIMKTVQKRFALSNMSKESLKIIANYTPEKAAKVMLSAIKYVQK